MVVYFYSFLSIASIKKQVRDLKLNKNSLFVIGFNEKNVLFLTKDYYRLLNFLKQTSCETACKFLLSFYIKRGNKKLLNALIISGGVVQNIIGESFTNKHCEIKINGFNILILFYFELFSPKIKSQVDIQNVDLTIGLDNDEIADSFVFLDNKFFNKLIVCAGNGKVRCLKQEKLIKKTENLCEYNIQKIKKLLK